MAMSQICKLISVLILGTCIVAALGSQGNYFTPTYMFVGFCFLFFVCFVLF